MFKQVRPKSVTPPLGIDFIFPHCDPRILHAPSECNFCDMHPAWQFLRLTWGIAFTGYTPDAKELPCPADNARGDSHKAWPGNQSTTTDNACNTQTVQKGVVNKYLPINFKGGLS
jgi:hypothetical protein